MNNTNVKFQIEKTTTSIFKNLRIGGTMEFCAKKAKTKKNLKKIYKKYI